LGEVYSYGETVIQDPKSSVLAEINLEDVSSGEKSSNTGLLIGERIISKAKPFLRMPRTDIIKKVQANTKPLY
jgi:hypothetical protein